MAKTLLFFGFFAYFCSVYTGCSASPEFPELDHIQPQASVEEQTAAVEELIQRLVPDRVHEFVVVIDPSIGPKFKDTFSLQTSGGQLSVTGTSGVAAASGFYYYLSQYCGCHISWAGVQTNLPRVLPEIAAPGVKVTSNDRFRYYQNVCTVSYSFVWWSWARWEKEIDWMAMSSINLPLAFNAQESIWMRVYTKMGFTEDELGRHFGGPAFLAWARMGNVHGWGGPLTNNWHIQQVELQHRILGRMRALGMIPVLPAFAGHVPETIKRLYPSANVSKLSDWGGFNSTYCCTTLLNFEDPLFLQIGTAFIKEYTQEFGTDHIYNTDTFNEMPPDSSSTAYLASAGQAVYNAMAVADPEAVWLMQGWLFTDQNFWQPTQAKALLTSVPIGRMIVLDLGAENIPQYIRLQSFFGQPFIWCMLHNFGGTLALFGAIQQVNNGPFNGRTLANSTMIGTGITPEGINQNDVMYEFMNQHMWRKEPANLSEWFKNYAIRRYGAASDAVATSAVQTAWLYLLRSVYNCTSDYHDHSDNVIVNSRPRRGIQPDVWYDPDDVFKAWDFMFIGASEFAASQLYRYDLVDVTRQCLQLLSIKFYSDVVRAFEANDTEFLSLSGRALLDLLADLDVVLQSDHHFLLGRWIKDARSLATSPAERLLYEYNARNQVTLWGPRGEILDYANKQWAGLVKYYYLPRWQLFIKTLEQSLADKRGFSQSKFNKEVFTTVESPFTFSTNRVNWTPVGDQIEISTMYYNKYRPLTKKFATFFQKLPSLYQPSRNIFQWKTKRFQFDK